MTQKFFPTAIADHHLDAANRGSNGRSSQPMFGVHEHTLRQTVIAVARGQARHGHNSASEATLYLPTGRIQVGAGNRYWDGTPGDLIIIPNGRHTLHALEDAAVLRAVAKTQWPRHGGKDARTP